MFQKTAKDIEARIQLLESRDPVRNVHIINKLKRQLRKMTF